MRFFGGDYEDRCYTGEYRRAVCRPDGSDGSTRGVTRL